MRFWIGFPRLPPLGPAELFGSGDFGRRRRPLHPVIVTEQHADPVELVFQAFLRLEPEQRARLIQRLKLRWGGPPKRPSPKGRSLSLRRFVLGAGLLWPTGSERQREAAMTDNELRNKNADLRNKIREVLESYPELRDIADEIALKQGMRVQVGTSFLERVQGNLEERARAMVEVRPDLAADFRGLLPGLSDRS